MTPKVLPLLLAAAALIAACTADTKTKAEYCAEMPAAVCARLFDEGCALIPPTAAPRYASKDECEAKEKAVCEARAAEAGLTFDGAAAAQCLADLGNADCAKAARADLHGCDKVFTEGDAGVAPITALDAGTPDTCGDAGAEDCAGQGGGPDGGGDL